jgi:hypothetical protein
MARMVWQILVAEERLLLVEVPALEEAALY